MVTGRRDPAGRWQQRIAWHELGHALVGKKLGLTIATVVHTGNTGWTDVNPQEHQWREDAVMSIAGSVGEWLWEKHHNGWFGSRSHCHSDLQFCRAAIQRGAAHGKRFSESQARCEARRILQRQRDRIEELAPRLITAGRLTGRQL